MRGGRISWAAGLLAAQLTAAYTLDLGSTESIKSVARSMSEDMMSFYTGNQPGGTPGLLPSQYYWWEAGALMGALVDYWYYTGDTRWNGVAEEGLLFQVGPNNDYMPPNQTMTEGNDDQGFWGMTVMSAAEYNFQNPPRDKPQWLALAQAVFNTQAARWEDQRCGGGLRWQIFTWNNGFNYKNSISQACFFNIAARLARYTGNDSYAEWAERTWDWMVDSELMSMKTYYIYDGIHVENCSEITPYQWTYNAGAFLLGAAAMYNYSTNATRREIWHERVDGLLNGSRVFFTGDKQDIMTEVACEPVDLCDIDQQSFKAYLSRWMAATVKWAPWAYDRVKPLLESSAIAATSACTGGTNGRMCGLKWTDHGKWDGSTGVGQQMAAMEVVLANMIQDTSSPVTDDSGGTSVGDPGAGGSDIGRTGIEFPPVSSAAKAGAYVDPILGLDSFLEGLRAFNSHRLLDFYASRLASCGATHYSITLGSWVLMTNEVENIKAILGTSMEDWPIAGPRLLATLPVLGPDSIFTSNGQAWHKARAMLRPSFVRDQVADLKCFDRHIRNLLAAIPADNTTFDIQNLLLDMTMDSSTDFLLGYSTNSLTEPSPEAQQFVKDFEYASRESAKKARLGPILYHLPHRELRKAVRGLREYVRFYLEKAAAQNEKGEAKERSYVFLDEILKANPPVDYTVDQILSILVAGRDTTAAALTAAFYFLARDAVAVDKLRSEILAMGEEYPTWEQLKQLKYLHNVIKEALRLFSPVSTNSRRSNKETVLPRGGGNDGKQPILVPEGTPVRWSTHAFHRSREIYGLDADEFRPERWENLRVGWEYIPFSGGPRICLGQQFALTQIAYTLFRFFRTFQAIDSRDPGPFLARTNLTISFPYGCLVSVRRA
ncbi:glycoside hydrolase family 76 protein [Trichocladium antarcticum]|uniref:mannan endo-1,6-alpha-mannosidase n=1 Tax=Trichocladium antarcticum TaxID=1450529 RepID=A0AAN6UIG6_9PEZI|nr:glycoside hydrolase family 76 protein [Trichocladium antarcticum]